MMPPDHTMSTWACPHHLKILTFAVLLISGCMSTPEEQLRRAAADGDVMHVKTLLGQGLAVEASDERRVTPLLMAAKNGHRDVVALLLEKGAAPNDARQDGVTPLLIAIQAGHADVVALLLEKGAEVNARSRMAGVTLLHVGAYQGNQDIIALLLKHGADKNARMSSGERPVDLARQRGHTALIPLLEP